jgi:5,10-methylenetetrahydrofolate reductase
LAQWRKLGVERVLALRGDAFRPRNDGPNSTIELVEFLTERGFRTSVAAYPEGHPDRKRYSAQEDRDWLQQKLAAGADQVVTQFSAQTAGILRLRNDIKAFSPDVTLKVGIMPIPAWDRYQTLQERCGIEAEAGEALLFQHLPEDSHEALSLGLAYANMRTLCSAGIEHFHLYGLNNARLLLPLIRAVQALNQTTTTATFH